ncbi:DUF6477 family protein [Roseinatronobacter sp. S2]|uniref:DUF6477 family protein n=1 Tax=Roseinatronobacter sp. S2 TaxID=3035471 RepID=UPI00241031BF|nr:DUF6477 family protein [Roseinatronobacter sp. S2]WFE73954.1 DUF6477 family protein [Roseinatronobacter sp. S2]
MKSLRTSLETTIRPRLLVVAARHAMCEYRRDTLLPKLLELPFASVLPPVHDAVQRLTLIEAMMDHARRRHEAGWRAADHVLVMAALMSETRSLKDMQIAPLHGTLGLRAKAGAD